jgi:hypothetical protein
MRRKVRLRRKKFDAVVEGKGADGVGEQDAAGAAADVGVGVGGANVVVVVVDEIAIAIAAVNATGQVAAVKALKGCNIQRRKWQ